MSNTTKIVIWVIVAVLVVWGIYSFTAAPQQGAPAPAANSITIGFVGPLTGDAASIGTVNRAAVELAASEVNQAGGVNGKQLNVIYEDGQCNAVAATNAAQKLINVDKVPVIIGGLCSTETAAIGPTAMQDKVILFSYASSAPNLSRLGKYFFRSYPSDAFQGKFAAEYAYNVLKARKVAILYHVSDWGSGLKGVFTQRFTELGGKISDTEGAPQDSRDYRTALTKIKASNPDLIYSPTYPDGGIAAVKQANELGIKMKFLGGDAWDDPHFQSQVAGKEDIIYTVPFTPVSDAFKAKMKAKTGSDAVPIGTENAYDNVKIIAQVMGQVGTDPDAIQAALHALKGYQGVSGTISFDQNGDITAAQYSVKHLKSDGTVEILQ